MCYARFNREQQFVILVNNDEAERSKELNILAAGVPEEAVMSRLIVTTEKGYSLMPETYYADKGIIHVTLQGKSAVILERV